RIGSWVLLSVSPVAKVGDPPADHGVIRHEPAVRLVMLQRARGVAQVQVAENGEIPVRVVKVGELRQGRLVARPRAREVSLAPLYQPELVVGDRVVRIRFERPLQARLGTSTSASRTRARETSIVPRSMCAAVRPGARS